MVNISASASLSGGPAKIAEKRSSNEKNSKKVFFRQNLICSFFLFVFWLLR
jgi:hypothetical protein